jgi:hypothetical protein
MNTYVEVQEFAFSGTRAYVSYCQGIVSGYRGGDDENERPSVVRLRLPTPVAARSVT